MQVKFAFELGQAVVEKATGVPGIIDLVGVDEIGITYAVRFEKRSQGRRLHWKRETEIKLAPKIPKKKTT